MGVWNPRSTVFYHSVLFEVEEGCEGLGHNGRHWVCKERTSQWTGLLSDLAKRALTKGHQSWWPKPRARETAANGEGMGGRGLPKSMCTSLLENSMFRSFSCAYVQYLRLIFTCRVISSHVYWNLLQFCPFSLWEWHWDICPKTRCIILGFTGSIYDAFSFFFP